MKQIESEVAPAKKDEQKPASVAQVQPSGFEGGPTKAVKTPYAYPPTPIGLYKPPPRDLVPKTVGSSETKVDSKGKETTTTEGDAKSLSQAEEPKKVKKHHKKKKHHHKKHRRSSSDSDSGSGSESESESESSESEREEKHHHKHHKKSSKENKKEDEKKTEDKKAEKEKEADPVKKIEAINVAAVQEAKVVQAAPAAPVQAPV